MIYPIAPEEYQVAAELALWPVAPPPVYLARLVQHNPGFTLKGIVDRDGQNGELYIAVEKSLSPRERVEVFFHEVGHVKAGVLPAPTVTLSDPAVQNLWGKTLEENPNTGGYAPDALAGEALADLWRDRWLAVALDPGYPNAPEWFMLRRFVRLWREL